jgi:hypothetical protein
VIRDITLRAPRPRRTEKHNAANIYAAMYASADPEASSMRKPVIKFAI